MQRLVTQATWFFETNITSWPQSTSVKSYKYSLTKLSPQVVISQQECTLFLVSSPLKGYSGADYMK